MIPSSRCYSLLINSLLDFYVGPTAESRIKDLTGAIKTNISKVRSESVIDFIEGANSDAKSAGLWQANWPIEHSGSCGTQPKVIPFPAFRAWLRVIPDGFSQGMPKVSACDQLSDDIRLVPPRGLICGRADSGPCEFGFLTYWISSEEEDGSRQANNLAAFLQETGEIWMSDGEAFYIRNNVRQLDHDNLLYNWGRGFKNAMACLNALGASKHRRVIVGIEGLRG